MIVTYFNSLQTKIPSAHKMGGTGKSTHSLRHELFDDLLHPFCTDVQLISPFRILGSVLTIGFSIILQTFW